MSSETASRALEPPPAPALPVHVAIIMDGNGRWASRRLMSRVTGHEKGAETVRMVVRACRELGIAHLTLYAFSTENWQRPASEVNALMGLLRRFIDQERAELVRNGIRLHPIGRLERLPDDVREALGRVVDETRDNAGLRLHLALSYGGRDEIARAARRIAEAVQAGRMRPEKIDEAALAAALDTAGVPDPDLLIRTGGELRVSNFLLWQIAYTEIFVTPTLWPDFSRREFEAILADFGRRERRFGHL